MLALARDRSREAISSDDALIVFMRESGGSDEPDAELSVREADAQDGELYARDIGTDSATTFRARLSDSTHCFVVVRSGRIVHSSWVTRSGAWTREIRGYMVPPPGDAYVYESFTRPEVRGRGVYPLALEGICRWAATQGVRSVWVAVEADNPASIRAVEKAGFEEAVRVSYRRRWGRLTLEKPTGRMSHLGANFVRRTT